MMWEVISFIRNLSKNILGTDMPAQESSKKGYTQRGRMFGTFPSVGKKKLQQGGWVSKYSNPL